MFVHKSARQVQDGEYKTHWRLVNRHRPISVVRSIPGGAEEHVGLAWESGSPRVRKAQLFIVVGLVLVIFGVGIEYIISVGVSSSSLFCANAALGGPR